MRCHATPAAIKSAKLDRIANMGQKVSFPEFDRELVVNLQAPQETAKVFHKYAIKIVSKNPNRDKELRFWFANGGVSLLASENANKKLNRLITDETEQIRFRAYYDDKMYAFCNVVGNVYVAWAEYVNYQNANKITTDIHKGMPLLLVCNGYYSISAVYLFGKPSCLHRNVCELMISTRELVSLLCLEKSGSNSDDVANSHMITNSHADTIALELVRKQVVSMDFEDLPFPDESDIEELEFVKEERVKIDEYL